MDKIILGLLMLKRFTVYEIRSIITRNFKAMCSDSLGSIQAAMKKLLAAQMVTCSEYREKSVNKKRYSITDKGRKAFMQWLETAADLSNSKNMELGKLLFMGLVPAKKRLKLLDEMVVKLEAELSFLLGVQASIDHTGKNTAIEYWKKDFEYYKGVKNATGNIDMKKNADDIAFYEIAALEYGIASMKFHIRWLKTLKNKVEEKLLNEKESNCNRRRYRRS